MSPAGAASEVGLPGNAESLVDAKVIRRFELIAVRLKDFGIAGDAAEILTGDAAERIPIADDVNDLGETSAIAPGAGRGR